MLSRVVRCGWKSNVRVPNCRPIPKHLLILHYHLRPGGVRRVVEMLLPPLAASGAFEAITLAVGEAPDGVWAEQVEGSLVKGVRFSIRVEPSLAYLPASGADGMHTRRKIFGFFSRFSPQETLVWAHNLGLGRNILLADGLARVSAATGLPILSQHHDFWFDNRWNRWPEFRAHGFRSLGRAARALFASGARVTHASINSADQSLLAQNLPGRSCWLPNPADIGKRPSTTEIRRAEAWLRGQLGHRGPVWILPSRFLRRKNLGEAVLLTRWLRPEAFLVTTAGVSSPEEADCAKWLQEAARKGGWPVRFGLLAGNDARAPSVPALLCAAERMLLTSLQEGFGLPFFEAATLGRPLLARRQGNVEPDLSRMGFQFPETYDEVFIPGELFDRTAEHRRQERLCKHWKHSLPRSCQPLAGIPPFLELPSQSPVPFSRLTPTAQEEVLLHPPAQGWKTARAVNPTLAAMTEKASQSVAWPPGVEQFVSPEACASRLLEAIGTIPETPLDANEAIRTQNAFIAERLSSKFLYPLLMPMPFSI